jgi:hypothetical protein
MGDQRIEKECWPAKHTRSRPHPAALTPHRRPARDARRAHRRAVRRRDRVRRAGRARRGDGHPGRGDPLRHWRRRIRSEQGPVRRGWRWSGQRQRRGHIEIKESRTRFVPVVHPARMPLVGALTLAALAIMRLRAHGSPAPAADRCGEHPGHALWDVAYGTLSFPDEPSETPLAGSRVEEDGVESSPTTRTERPTLARRERAGRPRLSVA